jgi:hypothetical protein
MGLGARILVQPFSRFDSISMRPRLPGGRRANAKASFHVGADSWRCGRPSRARRSWGFAASSASPRPRSTAGTSSTAAWIRASCASSGSYATRTRRIKQVVADLTLDKTILKDAFGNKMVSPAQRRALVVWAMQTYRVSERRACCALALSRSVIRYPFGKPTEALIRRRLHELAVFRPSCGVGSLTPPRHRLHLSGIRQKCRLTFLSLGVAGHPPGLRFHCQRGVVPCQLAYS